MEKFLCEKRGLDNNDGVKFRIKKGVKAISFETFFSLLINDPSFAVYFSKVLIKAGYRSVFLEFPAITRSSLQDEVEFVVINAARLNNVRANSMPFSKYFDQGDSISTVVDFMNLGNDTVLISPVPNGKSYGHLMTFLQSANETEIVSLWNRVATKVNDRLGSKPTWVSTSGLGVPWLHVRISNRPKYYTYLSYKVV